MGNWGEITKLKLGFMGPPFFLTGKPTSEAWLCRYFWNANGRARWSFRESAEYLGASSGRFAVCRFFHAPKAWKQKRAECLRIPGVFEKQFGIYQVSRCKGKRSDIPIGWMGLVYETYPHELWMIDFSIFRGKMYIDIYKSPMDPIAMGP